MLFNSTLKQIFVYDSGKSAEKRSNKFVNFLHGLMSILLNISAGSLRLALTDVRINPIVWFNYFSNTGNLEKCVNGTRKIGDVIRSRSMEEFKYQEWLGGRDFRYVGPALPVDQSNDLLMGDFFRGTVSTIWHYHGGCLVGKVVDRRFRVIGIGSL